MEAILTHGKTVDFQALAKIDAQSVDVPLVVGKGLAGSADLAEQNRELCLAQGFEYIDLNAQEEDDGIGGAETLSLVVQQLLLTSCKQDNRG